MTRSMLALGLLASVVSCKTADRSSSAEKSLGALAGDKTAETCSATPVAGFDERYETFWSQKSIVADVGYQPTLKSVFAAVPLELQSWFFLKGGKVQLTSDSKVVCTSSDTTLFDNTGANSGCVKFTKVDNFVSMPTIFVNITATTYQKQVEQASLIVQGFAAVLASYVTEIALSDKLSSSGDLLHEFGTYDVDMKNIKAGLAFIVIEDLNAAKNDQGQSLAQSLPDTYKNNLSASKALDVSVARDTRWTGFWNNYSSEGEREFINFIVTQVFETSWCNDKTRAILSDASSPFANTGKYFKREVEPVFAQAFASGDQTPATSLGLAGETNQSEGPGEIMSPAPDANAPSGFALGQGYSFPVLRAVIRAPFAVGEYFVQNKPVRTWFATHQPIRRVLAGTAQVVVGVARGAAVLTGRVVGRVGTAVGRGIDRVGYRVQHGCLIRRWRC